MLYQYTEVEHAEIHFLESSYDFMDNPLERIQCLMVYSPRTF